MTTSANTPTRSESDWLAAEVERLQADLPALPADARAALRGTLAAIVAERALGPAAAASAWSLLLRLDERAPVRLPADERRARATARLLRDCAAASPAAVQGPVRERLEAAIGERLAGRLTFALAPLHGRRHAAALRAAAR